MAMRYTLKDFTDITFNGFDIKLPEETLVIITELSQQVGSPTYVKTPTFHKRENVLKMGGNDSIGGNDFKRKKKNKPNEILNDDDWETIRSFQATKMEQKVGIDAQIDLMRSWLNKMSDKMYVEPFEKIMEILNQLIADGISDSDMLRVGTTIFDIASNNRFYSKLYADLYTKLIENYQVMRNIFNENLASFMELFNCIEYVDSEKDYDKFCKINKDNERRKALSLFFVNLTINKIISEDKLKEMASSLLNKLLSFIMEENRKNEVDEITENIALLYSYNKKLYDTCEEKFDGVSFGEMIEKLAHCKAKTYPSLSNKSIFKFMDLVEM
ncbi:MAG: hypothetical protein EBY20_06565 [Alphaproteobacteria bacterium]|nr:hypothetical protein [Alphaproteobacteria bacterium]